METSKNLRPIVTIYGYNLNDFCWKESNNSSIYRTSGLIVSFNGKKYVVTTRTRLSSCQNITMYYCNFDEKNTVYRNDLHIIFQSIEYNMIILGTVNKFELDLYDNNLSVNLTNHFYELTSEDLVIPKKKSKYYTTKIDIDKNPETTNYLVNIYDTKYIKSFINDNTYLPETYMYEFDLISEEKKLIGICGAVIFNTDNKLVGMISHLELKKIMVIPSKIIYKLISDFVTYMDRPRDYLGPLIIPMELKISKKLLCAKIMNKTTINTTDGNKILNKDDILVSIDGKEVKINDNEVLIHDNDYKNHIPLKIYLRTNMVQEKPIKMVVSRREQIFEYLVIGVPEKNFIFPLTNQLIFFPKYPIPFIRINCCILVQLTHELIHIMALNKIQLKNEIIDQMMEKWSNNLENHILMVDCLDKIFAKNNKLPYFTQGKKKNLNCPIVTMINGQKISTLEEVCQIITQAKDNYYLTKLGMTYKNQYDIKIPL